MNNIKVVIVDDHPVVRKGIESFIDDEEDIKIVGEASNPTDAMKVIEKTLPDIAVVDICLDNATSGLELIKALKERFPDIRVLVLSMYDEMIYAARALHLGARGYLQKNKGPKMIVDAIKAIMDGGTFFQGNVEENGSGLAGRSPDERKELIVNALTNRELEIFQLFGQGLETNDIARKLNLSKHTVDSHRKNIKEKMKIQKNNELVMIAAQWVMNNVNKAY